MATGGQFYWPSVGNSVAAYGQFFMAADTYGRPWTETVPRNAFGLPMGRPVKEAKSARLTPIGEDERVINPMPGPPARPR
ncbi:hypothetical protein IWX64_003430 [Arthrobacter sp. CAN_A212]